jgi:hypothetical protein
MACSDEDRSRSRRGASVRFGIYVKFLRGILIGSHSPPLWSHSLVLQIRLKKIEVFVHIYHSTKFVDVISS